MFAPDLEVRYIFIFSFRFFSVLGVIEDDFVDGTHQEIRSHAVIMEGREADRIQCVF